MGVESLPERINILDKIDKIVRDEIEKSNIPLSATLAIVGTIDSHGTKIMAAVKLGKNLKVVSIWEHNWDGNDSIAGKLIFTR